MKTVTAPLFDRLTANEKKLFLALCEVPDHSIWGYAVNNVMAHPTLTSFNELKRQLKSQAKDNPSLMESIIGRKAFTLLNKKA